MKKSILPALCASLALLSTAASAKTVAWWPLAYENGARTTVETVIDNFADPGVLVAKPVSMKSGCNVNETDSATCPQGAAGFASGWGVWNPEDGTTFTNDTALYFHKNGSTNPAGALKIADPEKKLQLQAMTFECFFKMQSGLTNKGDWYCIAVMPGKLRLDNGTKIKNYDSWGVRVIGANKLQFRFTKSSARAATTTDTVEAKYNQTLAVDGLSVYDDKWHHVAFAVSPATTGVNVYYDYKYKGYLALPNGLDYGPDDTDVYIGATPQTPGLFGGSIANVRISDETLEPADFLQLTDLARVNPDVVLDADFDVPEGMSFTEYGAINKGYGSYVTMVTNAANEIVYPCTASGDVPCETVYESILAESGSADTKTLVNKQPTTGKTYGRFVPVGDDFTNKSFTVECHYKTTQSAQYIPLVRRRGGNNVQFNLGFGGTKGALSATVLAEGNNSKAINDTVRSNDGQWHHAALVVDAQTKTLTLYKDYQKVGSNTFVNEKTLVAGTTPVCIAGVDNGNMFDGQIDNVRITMRALKVGEFVQPDHVAIGEDKVLGWASFEDTLDAAGGTLQDGVAEAATADGAVPAFVEVPGRNPKLVNAANETIKADNYKAISIAKGVVKYPDNRVLPLVKNQTVEFFMKSGPQAQFSGIARCNVAQNDASVPVWGLSFAEYPVEAATKLRVRCAVRYASGTVNNTAINTDTDIDVGDNKWHHIAMTIQETTQEDGTKKTKVSIYKDKSTTPDWEQEVGGELNYGDGNASIWLGASSSKTAFYTGLFDELKITEGVVAPADFLSFGKNGLAIILR